MADTLGTSMEQEPLENERLIELAVKVRDDLHGVVAPKAWQSKTCRSDLKRYGVLSHRVNVNPNASGDTKVTHLHIVPEEGRPLRVPIRALLGPVIYRSDRTVVQRIFLPVGNDLVVDAVLKSANSKSDAGEFMIAREKQVAAHLIARNVHAPVIKPYAVCKEGIVYEYIGGNSGQQASNLAQVLSTGKITLNEWVNILAQIASALSNYHSEELMYLDLKPENILVDINKHAYLGDPAGVRRYGDIINPDEEGFISNRDFYDLSMLIDQQRILSAQDVPDKRAFGLLLKLGLDNFAASSAKRKLEQLAQSLIDSPQHPFPYKSGSDFKDAYYYSWKRIAQFLTPKQTATISLREEIRCSHLIDPRKE